MIAVHVIQNVIHVQVIIVVHHVIADIIYPVLHAIHVVLIAELVQVLIQVVHLVKMDIICLLIHAINVVVHALRAIVQQNAIHA